MKLARRLTQLFLRDETRGGWRPVLGDNALWQTDPHWHDYVPFYEYFHGENGAGLGASHQGWTTLVADLLRPCGGPSARRGDGLRSALETEERALLSSTLSIFQNGKVV